MRLKNKWLIYITPDKADNNPKLRRFFNRKTQKFTGRFDNRLQTFHDISGASIGVYFTSHKVHNKSWSTWQAMNDKEDNLYCKTTLSYITKD